LKYLIIKVSVKDSKSYWQGWHSPRHLSLLTNKGFALLFQKTNGKLQDICDTEPLMRLPYGGLVEWKKRDRLVG
jgi:hypothetical protein